MKNTISRSALALLFTGSMARATTIPLPASHEVWAAAKKSVTLSTGITMKFVEAGNTLGPVAIFLHGYTDSSRSFFPMLQTLIHLRPDLHFFALDQRGHGASSMPSASQCPNTPDLCFDVASFGADVLAFMDSKNIAQAYLIGHSLGSFVADNVAINHPERVLRQVLIGTATNVRNNPVVAFVLDEVNGPWKTALTSRGVRWPSGAYTVPPIDADPYDALPWIYSNFEINPMVSPSFAGFVTLETSRTPIGTWLGVGDALLATDITRQLNTLAVPTLILWGTQDAVFPASDQRTLLATLDQASGLCSHGRYYHKTYGKVPLPPSGLQESDVGHLVQWDAPAGVAKDLAAYLQPNGKPTRDLYYADPTDFRNLLTAPGHATIIVGPASCH